MVPSTTHGSDINELAVTYFFNREEWVSGDLQSLFSDKAKLLPKYEVTIQVERARAMFTGASAFLWETFPGTDISEVKWVGRSNAHAGMSANHPADVLLHLSKDGATTVFGVSCKSSNGRGDIGFKNSGIGPLEQVFGVALSPITQAAVVELVRDFTLPTNQAERKIALRASGAALVEARTRGSLVLKECRDKLLSAMQGVPEPILRSFLTGTLLDCDSTTVPHYIKVTGYGNRTEGFHAKVHNPFADTLTGTIRVDPCGNDSIGFSVVRDGQRVGSRICLLRFKFESEKLASSLKTSTDPWV